MLKTYRFLITRLIKKLQKLFLEPDNIHLYILLFLISTLIVIILPGPTYYSGFLLGFVIFTYLLFKDLTVALFTTYLLVFFFERPFIHLNPVLLQESFYFTESKVFPLLIIVPVRVIIFAFFLISLFVIRNKGKRKPILLGHYLSLAIIMVVSILTLLITNQFIGSYSTRFTWHFIRLFQIFLTFPTIAIFFLKRAENEAVFSILKTLVFSFVVASIIIQGIIAIAQFTSQSRLNLRIEHAESHKEGLFTPEENIFRSPGTFAFPNYLGVNISMLLPFPVLFLINRLKNLDKKNGKIKKSLSFLTLTSIFTGLVAFFLNFSRWVWVSFLSTLIITIILGKASFPKELSLMSKIHKKRIIKVLSIFIVILLFMTAKRFQVVKTLKSRFDIARQTVFLIKRHPIFGVGPAVSGIEVASIERNYDKYISSLRGVHNTFLYIAADNGLIIAVLFIAFILTIIFKLLENLKEVKKDWLAFSLMIGMLLFLFNSLAYPLYIFDTSLELFLLFAAIIFTLYQKNTPFI